MKSLLNPIYLLSAWFCLYVPIVTAQINSIDPRTALPSACIAPSAQTEGLEFTADSSYLRLSSSGNEAYASINGERMKRLVEEQAEIARRYRQAGNQYWGRIIGTSSDQETADWMIDQLRQTGVENTRLDAIPLPTQWLPRSWQLSVELEGKTIELNSAWPAYGSVGTSATGEKLELIDVGLGMATDFQGRDVNGKAVVLHSIATSSTVFNSVRRIGALQRAEEQGAAAIFIVLELPGNLQTAFYDVGTSVPTFSIGSEDGALLQRLLTETAMTEPVEIDVQLEVEYVDGLSTSSVRGEVLAASADAEKIVIVAHRDAYFEGAADNASGVATALELMRYFAQIPKADRLRSVEIIGTPGHHNIARTGFSWLYENRESILDNAVLLINAEHTAHALIDRFGDDLCTTNSTGPFSWQINGSNKLAEITLQTFDEFGIPRWAETGGPVGEIRTIADLVPSIVLMHAGVLLHTNIETTEAIPAVSLAATTRAYAKIIERVNSMDSSELTQ
jgi:hypothetical protein